MREIGSSSRRRRKSRKENIQGRHYPKKNKNSKNNNSNDEENLTFLNTATIYDLSHNIHRDTPTYVGEPQPEFHQLSDIEKQKVNVSKIIIGSHTGTHVDAPRHFLPEGLGIDRVSLSTFIGEAIILDLSQDARKGIGSDDLERCSSSANIRRGDILLLYTGTSDLWGVGESARTNFSYLDPSGADWIIAHGIKCIGIDSFSVERFGFDEAVSHKKLLSSGIGIVEGLSNMLKNIVGRRVYFVCLPLRLENLDGSPVRAIALTPVMQTDAIS